jgi:hypothetical protein
MRAVADLLNDMVAARVFRGYAVFGAMAQMRYTEPVATMDVDVLVDLPDPARLDALSPIYRYCADRGFAAEGEAIRVEAWPVQFVPAHNALLRDAVERAEAADFDGRTLRVVAADHLAVIALDVGRPKDYARILSLLESGATTPARIAALAERHGLRAKWESFLARYAP